MRVREESGGIHFELQTLARKHQLPMSPYMHRIPVNQVEESKNMGAAHPILHALDRAMRGCILAQRQTVRVAGLQGKQHPFATSPHHSDVFPWEHN